MTLISARGLPAGQAGVRPLWLFRHSEERSDEESQSEILRYAQDDEDKVTPIFCGC